MAPTLPLPSIPIPLVHITVATSPITGSNNNTRPSVADGSSALTSSSSSPPSANPSTSVSQAPNPGQPANNGLLSPRPSKGSSLWLPNFFQTATIVIAVAFGGVGMWYMHRTDRIQIWTAKKDEWEYCHAQEDLSMAPQCLAVLTTPLEPMPYKVMLKRSVDGFEYRISLSSMLSRFLLRIAQNIILTFSLLLSFSFFKMWQAPSWYRAYVFMAMFVLYLFHL